MSLVNLRDSLVKSGVEKIKQKRRMAPLLLVREPANLKVIIADGYHRLCAVYSCDEDAVIPCQIA